MKKLIAVLLSVITLGGCYPITVNNKNMMDNDKNTSNNDQENQFDKAAVKLMGSVFVTGSGNDEPLDEMNEKVAAINSLNVSAVQEDKTVLDNITVKKLDETNLKGQVWRFENQFIAMEAGNTKFTFSFRDKDDKEIYQLETEQEISKNSIWQLTSEIDQESTLKNPDGKIKEQKITVTEITEKFYAPGQIIVGLKDDDEISETELKKLLEEKGIKVTKMKGLLNFYTVSFSSPGVPAALILASELDRFKYVEQNGIVNVQL